MYLLSCLPLLTTQTMVPALVESVKVAGLVLVSNTSQDTDSAASRAYRMLGGVDGVLKGNGVLRFNETVDM